MKLLKGSEPTGWVARFDRLSTRAATLLVLLVTAFAFGACGGSDGETSSTTASKASAKADAKDTFLEEHPGTATYGSPPLELEADPSGKLAYTTDEVTAKAGNVVIEFTNPQSTPHNVAIEDVASGYVKETKTISNGFDAGTTFSLYPGEKYVFFCTVPGHRKAGMEGTLKVAPG